MTPAAELAERFEVEAAGLDQSLAVEVARALWAAAPLAERRRVRDERLRAAAARLGGSAWQKAITVSGLVRLRLSGRRLPAKPGSPEVAAAVTVIPRNLTPRATFATLKSRGRNFKGSGAALVVEREITR